jgi:hypothetical protein
VVSSGKPANGLQTDRRLLTNQAEPALLRGGGFLHRWPTLPAGSPRGTTPRAFGPLACAAVSSCAYSSSLTLKPMDFVRSEIGGERQSGHHFAMRSMASGGAFHVAYYHATQQVFLGKRHGWERLQQAVEKPLALGCTDAAASSAPADGNGTGSSAHRSTRN